ncbi:GNAT family N-acetyltransferase [Pandoraea terrae]|uniref:GNAT family N-acetyltransferase n=1 Tax=Pandoraea terrae TaxID=1537710 RepID=A0A5E4RMY2_9BURK|nr:GNAT family N-acetyltransferase [Pandoraea terrae]VVD63894.1 GNAT family N-acetyltransferase [Pandoraea terrae]
MTYRTQVVERLDALGPAGSAAWDALLAAQTNPTPFLRHAFLQALEVTGCVTPETGWAPRHLLLWDGDTLAGAAPLYMKAHSYGEYVFDWAWADAYQQHGLAYYPKLLCAVPFTPVAGARLLARDDAARRALVEAMMALAAAEEVSSLHVLFPDDADFAALRHEGMLARRGVQFHWQNPGYADFDAFLATLNQKKRKNIRAERRTVREAGVTFRHVDGFTATEADWRHFAQCYRTTYREHHSTPYLNLKFFLKLAETMPENLFLVIGERNGQAISSSLLVHQPGPDGGTLYGRYWGALERVPCLHFETAYYQPQDLCIARGIALFEGGAQGEHKLWRGFLPIVTQSAHWLAHPSFSDAVARFLARERGGIDAYVSELNDHAPFRQDLPDTAAS